MTPLKRATKRAVVIAIYVIILSGLITASYFIFRTKPTCGDGKKNQGEEGIDCGGPCAKCEVLPNIENIQIVEKYVIPAGQNKYDALVKIKNPNSLFGVANFDYSFDFLDKSGSIIARQEGNSFLLPAETKYIFAFNIDLPQSNLGSLSFKIKSFKWQKFTDYEEPDVSVYQKEFNFVSGGSGFAQLKAKIQNRSNFDFRKIATRVVVKDTSGRPVAVNETNNNDVKVNEEREVVFGWNYPFTENIDVQNIEINPEVNVFDDENFMKIHGSPEQYRSYETESSR